MNKRLLALALILVASNTWAVAEFVSAQTGAKQNAAPLPKEAKASTEVTRNAVAVPQDEKAKGFRCYTNATNCSGVAYFKNTNAKGIGCTIWIDNGAAGRVNFTLGPGESTAYNVIYNDTYSCVWIEYAPPEPNVQRYYIGVS